MARRWRRRGWIAFLCGVGLVWGLWTWWKDHRYQHAMEGIESEILGGHYALACRNLENLLSWNSDSNGGITYLLGSCELARGRNQAADVAWARVLPGSAFSERARSAGVCVYCRSQDNSRPLKQLINDAARDRRNDATALRVLLVPMFSDQGRIIEADRLIEERLGIFELAWRSRTRARDQAAPGAHRAHLEAHACGKTSRRRSDWRPGWPPMTIGSGWVKPTWPPGLATMTEPGACWMPASSAGPRICRSGVLA